MAAAPTLTAPASTPSPAPAAPAPESSPAAAPQARPSRRQPSLVQRLNGVKGPDLTESSTNHPVDPGEEIPQDGLQQDGELELQPQQEQFAVETEVPEADFFRIAQEDGLDPTDAADLKAIEKIYAREQRAKTAAPATGQPADDAQVEAQLTPFERSLLAQPAAAKPNEVTPPAAAAPPAAQPAALAQQQSSAEYPSLPDIGQTWKTPIDAISAEMAEYGRLQEDMQAGRPPDFTRLHEVQSAARRREFLQNYLPHIAKIVGGLLEQHVPNYFKSSIQEHLGPLEPLHDFARQQQMDTAQRAAVSDLSEMPNFKEISSMFAVTQNSKPLKFKEPDSSEEVQVPDTPMNRIMIQHPELLRIQIPADPERGIDSVKAHRLTLTARYRQAALIHFGKRPDPQAAQALVNAGARMATRLTADQIRQGLNSSNGTPAGGAGSPNGSSKPTFVKDLVSRGGVTEGISLDSLVRRK